MAYCGYVVKVKDIRGHNNADRLKIATFFGNDVVVGLDVQEGDLGVYFPTDGRLSEEFVAKNNLSRSAGGYIDDERRNVKSIKLRGEKSDGIYLSIKSLDSFTDTGSLKVGDTITTVNGKLICEKYIPKGKNVKPMPVSKNNKKKKAEDVFPLFEQHADTAQLAYNMDSFTEGDLVYLTLKLHGTSQRISNTVKKSDSFINKILDKLNISPKKWEYVTGTRKVVLENFDGGFYGSNKFRKQWHDFFIDKLPKGFTVYFEVVGYTDEGKLIMPKCDNNKLKDKEFIKKYGEQTKFTYGCEEGESDIYVYRMTMTNEDGHVVEIPWEQVKIYCDKMNVKYTPELDKFLFTTWEDLMSRVIRLESGVDPIGKTHIREGLVARIEGKEKFTAFKQKSFDFKVLESIIKEEDILDMEEAESSNINR